MSKQAKVTFGKFSEVEFKSDDREMDLFVNGAVAGRVIKRTECVLESTMASYDRWAVAGYTVELWDVGGQDFMERSFDLSYDRAGNLRPASMTWREALKAAKNWARKQLEEAAEEEAALEAEPQAKPQAAAEAAEEQAAPEAEPVVDWHKLRADMAVAIKKATDKGVSRPRMDALMESVINQATDCHAWIADRGLAGGSEGIDAFLAHVQRLAFATRQPSAVDPLDLIFEDPDRYPIPQAKEWSTLAWRGDHIVATISMVGAPMWSHYGEDGEYTLHWLPADCTLQQAKREVYLSLVVRDDDWHDRLKLLKQP